MRYVKLQEDGGATAKTSDLFNGSPAVPHTDKGEGGGGGADPTLSLSLSDSLPPNGPQLALALPLPPSTTPLCEEDPSHL